MHLKLAHLILAHAYPDQLLRLVKRLQHPDTHIYIHLDEKTDLKKFEKLQEVQNVFFIKNRIHIYWGTYSLVQATLNSMDEILQADFQYSHINLLSAQDYPLKSAEDAFTFFQENAGKSFLDMPLIDKEWPEGVHRLVNYNFGDYRFPGHYLIQHLVNLLRIKRKVIELDLYGRSQWLAITPECAAYVIKFLQDNPDAKRYFRMSFAPDEFIFQTILGNSPFKDNLVNDNLRYIDFPVGKLHPNTLTIANAMALTQSGKLYARKFDPKVDSMILNYLDWIAKFGYDMESKEIKCLKYIFTK